MTGAEKQKLISVRTSDDVEFLVERKVICQSNLIKNLLEDLEDSGDSIPLPNITGPVMEIVLKYARAHKNDIPEDDEEAVQPAPASLDIDKLDSEIISVPKKTLFDIILAANYLDFTGLLDLGCKAIANDLKDKTIDQVYEDYDVPLERRFTEEERAKVEEELAWAATANKS